MKPRRALLPILLAAVAGAVASAPVGAAVNLFGFRCCYHVTAGAMLPSLSPSQLFSVSAYDSGAGPEAGDIIFFRLPALSSVPFVSRVIGRPRDHVQMIAGVVYVNGGVVKRERVGEFVDTNQGRTVTYRRWRETLANGVSYETIDRSDTYDFGDTSIFDTPAGKYFVLGDRRDGSLDSRDQTRYGYVPLADILGKVKPL